MRGLLVLFAACGPRSAPPLTPPPLSTPNDAGANAVQIDAAPQSLSRSSPLGPPIEALAGRAVARDHELTLVTKTERITITGPDAVEVAPVDDPAGRVVSPDGTWAVEQDYKRRAIVAGAFANGALAKPRTLYKGAALVRFVGGSGAQRVVVLDRGNWGWFVVRSSDAGVTWTETRYDVAGRIMAPPRRWFDLVTRDGDWVRIDRDGELATVPIREKNLVPDTFACAAAKLWIARSSRLFWIDPTFGGSVPTPARGPMICAGEAVLVPTDGGVTRCTHAGCSAIQPGGDFMDLTGTGIATATQHGSVVRATVDGRALDAQLDAGEQLVGLAVWAGIPTLLLLQDKRLRLAPLP